MPAFLIRVAIWFSGYIVTSLISKLLLGAGLAFVSYTFVNDLVAEAQVRTMGLYGNLPSDIIGVLGILKIPQSLSVLFSALGISAFIQSAKLYLGKSG